MEYIWTTKDGAKININDMDENHLRNTIKLLIRNPFLGKRKKVNNQINVNYFDEVMTTNALLHKCIKCGTEYEDSNPLNPKYCSLLCSQHDQI